MPEYKGIIVSHWTIAADSPEEATNILQQTGAQIRENYANDFLVECAAVAGALLPDQTSSPQEEKPPCPTTPSNSNG